jgi:hypothetical protein
MVQGKRLTALSPRHVKTPLFLFGKAETITMVADETIAETEGITAEFGAGALHLALKKLPADHPGTTNSLGIPHVEDIHKPTPVTSSALIGFFDLFFRLFFLGALGRILFDRFLAVFAFAHDFSPFFRND